MAVTKTPTAPNAFIGRTEPPTAADLEQALGPAKPVWDGLIAELASQRGVSIHEWKCYSPKQGWSLRLLRGKRTIVWLGPLEGCFRAMFILGDKAVRAVREAGLSGRALQALDEAEKYPEGTGVRLLVKSAKDLAAVKKFAQAKLEN